MARGYKLSGKANKRVFRSGYNKAKAKNMLGNPMMRGGTRL